MGALATVSVRRQRGFLSHRAQPLGAVILDEGSWGLAICSILTHVGVSHILDRSTQTCADALAGNERPLTPAEVIVPPNGFVKRPVILLG
jgi:hypothetical protein